MQWATVPFKFLGAFQLIRTESQTWFWLIMDPVTSHDDRTVNKNKDDNLDPENAEQNTDTMTFRTRKTTKE